MTSRSSALIARLQATGEAPDEGDLVSAHLRDGVRDLDRRVGALDRLARGGRQAGECRAWALQPPGHLHVGLACGVPAVQTLEPRARVRPSPGVVRAGGDRRDAIGVKVRQTLRHPDNREVLVEEREVFRARAFRNRNRLREVRRIDDDHLRPQRTWRA